MRISVKDVVYIYDTRKYPWFFRFSKWELEKAPNEYGGYRTKSSFGPIAKIAFYVPAVIYAFGFIRRHPYLGYGVLDLAKDIINKPGILMVFDGTFDGFGFRAEKVYNRTEQVTSAPTTEGCVWHENLNDDGRALWECSACNVKWDLTYDTPSDHEMAFCPKCGRKILEEVRVP